MGPLAKFARGDTQIAGMGRGQGGAASGAEWDSLGENLREVCGVGRPRSESQNTLLRSAQVKILNF